MSIVRQVILLVLAATTAMVFMAGTATARSPVEVEDENSEPCNPFCHIHLDGENHLTRLDNGLQVSTCEEEVEFYIRHDGTGEAEWTGTSHGAPGCNTINCAVMSPHWVISGSEEPHLGEIRFTMTVCLRNPLSGVESECNVSVEATEISSHRYEFTAAQPCPSGVRYEFIAVCEPDTTFLLIHHR